MPVVATRAYIESHHDGYWISGTRISLDSVVYLFRQGIAPEAIVQAFPLLSLEQVYGAIAFYLANRETIDQYLVQEELVFEQMSQPLQQDDQGFYHKLKMAREVIDLLL